MEVMDFFLLQEGPQANIILAHIVFQEHPHEQSSSTMMGTRLPTSAPDHFPAPL